MLLNGHEPETVRFVKNYVRSGWIVADIGAHFGIYTLALARCVGSTGRVVAFEPNPAPLLRFALTCNGYRQVHLERKAVSDIDGPISFYTRNKGTDSLIAEASRGGTEITVDSVTLDSYFEGSRVDFIKIDAEGAELRILRGATRLIRDGLTCTIELSPKNLFSVGIAPEAFVAELRMLGFQLFWICADGTYRPFIDADITRVQGHVNIFCDSHR